MPIGSANNFISKIDGSESDPTQTLVSRIDKLALGFLNHLTKYIFVKTNDVQSLSRTENAQVGVIKGKIIYDKTTHLD